MKLRKKAIRDISKVLIMLTVGSFMLTGCDCDTTSRTDMTFKGNHELRKIGPSPYEFFVLRFFPTSTVTFSWKMTDGSYAISTLPINQIRNQFDANATPYVKFRWKDQANNQGFRDDIQDQFIEYAVIVCPESEWPSDISVFYSTSTIHTS